LPLKFGNGALVVAAARAVRGGEQPGTDTDLERQT
jgi:hypothetical protein